MKAICQVIYTDGSFEMFDESNLTGYFKIDDKTDCICWLAKSNKLVSTAKAAVVDKGVYHEGQIRITSPLNSRIFVQFLYQP